MDNIKEEAYNYIIGIVGLGVLGTAIRETFESFTDTNTNTNMKIKIKCYDKYKNTIYCKSIQELLICDIIFLCLPTEYDNDKKEYNKTEIDKVCYELSLYRYQGIIILKSTVEPKTTENISIKNKAIYPHFNIVHSPEFLSARTATEDFKNQNHIVLGFIDSYKHKFSTIEYLKKFYKLFFPNAKISICSSNESESMKIFCNSFYASKIQIFTEFKLLCDKMDIEYNNVKDLMIDNGWINPMHTQIPGHDGQLSFGGNCFPKDIKSLNVLFEKYNVSHKVIDAVVEEHCEMRNEK